MFTSSFRSTALVVALAVTGSGLGIVQNANAQISGGAYSFRQKGEMVDFTLSPTEVLEVDKRGVETIVRLDGVDTVQVAVQRASKPPKGTSASHLVFYPAGYEGVEEFRRVLRERLMVELLPDADPEAVRAALGAQTCTVYAGSTKRAVLEFRNAAETLSKVDEAAAAAGVVAVEPLLAFKLVPNFIPNDPYFADNGGVYQWYLNNSIATAPDANTVDAWDAVTGAGVTIAVADLGTETEHPDLINKINLGLSFNWNDGDPADPNPQFDDETHGTNVSGLAAGEGDNAIGMCGTAFGAQLAALRLIAGFIDDADIAAAMSWMPDDVDIINNSWGPATANGELVGPGELTLEAFRTGAITGRGGLGTIWVKSAGNSAELDERADYDGFCTVPETITVGAVADTGSKSYYSEPGACLLISGPSGGGSQEIVTANYRGEGVGDPPVFPNPDYIEDFSGTSASAPIVSGVIALMLEANPGLGWRDVQEILIKTAVDVTPSDPDWYTNNAGLSFNHQFGAGLVDATAAVAEATAWTNLGARVTHQLYNWVGQDIPNGDDTSYVLEMDLSDVAEYPNLRVEHVEAVVNISHERRADLEIVLVSPSGTQSVLSSPFVESTEQSIYNWPFMSVRNWGEGSAGVWILKVTDTNPENSGLPNLFNAVDLLVHGTVDPGAPVSNTPVLISNRIINGVEGEPLLYVIETLNTDSVVVGALPTGLNYDPVSWTISGEPRDGGQFETQVVLTGPGGTTNETLIFTIEPYDTALGSAVEQPGRKTFSNHNGPGPWVFEYGDTNGDTSALGSPLGMNDDRWSEFGFRDGTDGPQVVFYDWRVSSEPGYDRLFFTVGNASPIGAWNTFISGDTSWRRAGAMMPDDGTNQVAWRYMKDSTLSAFLDRGFVNQVEFMTHEEYMIDLTAATEANFDLIPTERTLWVPMFDAGTPRQDWLESSGIGNGQAVMLEAQLEGPGELTFDWRVSVGDGAVGADDEDMLSLLVNGAPWEIRTGYMADYETIAVLLPDGPNTIQWEYRKDFTGTWGEDRAYLDNFFFDPTVVFSTWARRTAPTPADQLLLLDADGDIDGDGVSNFGEYAWGTDPFASDTSSRQPKLMTNASGPDITQLTIEYVKDTNLEDLLYTLEESTDMAKWTTVPEDGANHYLTETSREGLETWRAEFTFDNSEPSRFFRVKAVEK